VTKHTLVQITMMHECAANEAKFHRKEHYSGGVAQLVEALG